MTAGRRAAAHDATAAQATATAAEAAATRATLNHALGGSRRYTWMGAGPSKDPPVQRPSSPSAPKRKRGRPSLAQTNPQLQPPQALPTDLTSPTLESSLDRHLSSNSTSPQLANVVSRSQRVPPAHPPTAIVPLSPSSSEDANVDPAQTSHLRAAGRTSASNGGEGGIGESSTLSPSAQARQPTLGKRSRLEDSQCQFGPASQRERMATANPSYGARADRQQQPEQLRATSTSQPQSRSPSLESHYHVQTSTPQGQFGPPSRLQTHSQGRSQVDATPPQVHSPFCPPGAFSHAGPQQLHRASISHQTSSITVQPQSAAPTRRAADCYTVRDCQDAMNHFFASHQTSQLHPQDLRRLTVLRDAMTRQDWDYVAMHQFYCLADVAPKDLPESIRSDPNWPPAMELMRAVLDFNNTLSPRVLKFFVAFPVPIPRIPPSEAFSLQLQSFKGFLCLSGRFPTLRTACEKRLFPPLARELHDDLGISSPMFQKIVFTAILRRMSGPPDALRFSGFENDVLNLFAQNQAELVRQRSNRPAQLPAGYELQEKYQDYMEWGPRFKNRIEQHLLSVQQARATSQQMVTSQQPLQGMQPLARSPHGHESTPSNGASRTQHTLPSQSMLQSPRFPPPRPGWFLPPHQGPHPRPRPPSQSAQGGLRAGFLFPASGHRQPQQRLANPARFALHQADLRSPALKPRVPGSVMYQYVRGFIKTPTRLSDAGHKVETWAIPVAADAVRSIPLDIPGMRGARSSRVIDEQSQTFRLRCVKWPADELPDVHTWAVTDTSWIPQCYLKFNGTCLNIRKKLHYGKDLPIDISSLIKESENTLEIAIMRKADDTAYTKYLLAVEIIGVKHHDAIKQECLTTNLVPAAKVRGAIQDKLAGSNDDDEIAIVQCNLTINLFDPFSASQICDIPARSKACLHNDCFDLETYLQTRNRKGDVSVVDAWRCPICNVDARPQHLIVDGFLQNVHRDLERQGLLRTRAIIVDQDGSWKPKAEPKDNGVQDRSTPDEDDLADSVAPAAASNPAGVIDLSD